MAIKMISIPIKISYLLVDSNTKFIIKTKILKYRDIDHEKTKLTETTKIKCV